MSVKLPAFLQQSKADLHAKFVDLEWQQRNRILQGTKAPQNPSDPPSQWARLTGDHITARNRYLNVEPYAQNRVKLLVADGQNDYINASPIQLGTRRYIATQGPKETSVNHFYRMIAVPDLRAPVVVVMLTQTHEAGREKCFQYFPLTEDDPPLIIPPDDTIPDGFQGQVQLQGLSSNQTTKTEVRHLLLSTATDRSSDPPKAIFHCLFSGWPDFLVPEGRDRSALIELVRSSARLNATPDQNGASSSRHCDASEQSNPRIIHCSAGVGRSGTFIALDYLIDLMDTGGLDNVANERDPIFETVDKLRQQRMMMVQGEAQFYFLYDVIRELLNSRFTAPDVKQAAVHADADDEK
nr:tyrosine-protein phosphatase 1 [Quercus suber]